MGFAPGPEIIFGYFKHLSATQKDQFKTLADLYRYWNQRINVISRKDMSTFYQNHVLHSLGIAMAMKFNSDQQVLDVGTGGGFPGIPLAILFPETRFHLIDSIGKKIKVVQLVIDALRLDNVTCEQTRAEQHLGTYDVIVSRAVTRLDTLVNWVKPCLATEGRLICLKGGDLEQEIKETRAKVTCLSLSKYFSEPYFETKKVIVVG